MSSASRSRAMLEAHLSALVRVYALAIQKYQDKEMPAEQGPKRDSPETRRKVNTEGVSDVER